MDPHETVATIRLAGIKALLEREGFIMASLMLRKGQVALQKLRDSYPLPEEYKWDVLDHPHLDIYTVSLRKTKVPFGTPPVSSFDVVIVGKPE